MSLFVITGGIGAGKTTVLNSFRRYGAFGLDADDIAHSLYEPGASAYEGLLEHWGRDILSPDGTVDRRKVAEIVFRDSRELGWLNGFLHPLIRSEIIRQASGRCCFCAIPLFYESGWSDFADAVIAVWCSPADQMKRLAARGWSPDEISRRCSSQLSMDRKLELAQYAIISSCPWDCLERQCQLLCHRLQATEEPST